MGETVILYEHGCPRCKVLKAKLDQSGIKYTDINDVELMKAKGFEDAPQLEIDGVIYGFKDAINWVNNNKGE